ncbi:MAG: DUF4276 family protein [Polyangiaceae bacterium]|nr:DUF4276 family protein [Polyangiaceae bacterium]
MTIHVLVEGPSELAFFERWAPRLLQDIPVRIHPHQGKGILPKEKKEAPDPKRRGVLDQLPAMLRGFANALDPTKDAVIVLVDADNDDQETLRKEIEKVATTYAPILQVRATLAVEETEAFYLGDLKALETAFPEADLVEARKYEPDSICGTWELFGKIVGDGGGNKVAWAKAMGPCATVLPARSRSPSFKELIACIMSLLPSKKAGPKRRPYRHPLKPRDDRGRRR